jgi:hypothetical protein
MRVLQLVGWDRGACVFEQLSQATKLEQAAARQAMKSDQMAARTIQMISCH